MKRITLISLAIALTAASAVFAQQTEPVKPAPLPTAKEVLDKYVKAVGGRDVIQKVKSRISAGTLELMPMNIKGTFEIYAAPEAKSYSKMSIAGIGDIVEGSDGRTAWLVHPVQGTRDRTGAELAQTKTVNDFYRDIRLEKLFPKLEVKGMEKVGARDVYVVVATAEGIPAETWYFDTQTGLMLRSDFTAVVPEGNQTMNAFYEDHRPVDGLQIPFRIRIRTSSFDIVMTSKEVKHGAVIDDSKFAKPKQ
jgi:zinc protease